MTVQQVLQRQCDRLAVEKSVLERDLGKTDTEHAKLQAKIDKLEQDLQQALHEVHVRDDKVVQVRFWTIWFVSVVRGLTLA